MRCRLQADDRGCLPAFVVEAIRDASADSAEWVVRCSQTGNGLESPYHQCRKAIREDPCGNGKKNKKALPEGLPLSIDDAPCMIPTTTNRGGAKR